MKLNTHLRIPKSSIMSFSNEEIENYLNNLIITNPKYKKAQELGFSTKGIKRKLQLYRENEEEYLIPRHYNKLPGDLSFEDFKDERAEGEKINIETNIELWEDQKPAVGALEEVDDGILCAPCGSGKTAIAIESIAREGRKTLVLVHKSFLMNQWKEEIKEFTGLEAGIIRGDRWDYNKSITIGMLQTLYSRREEIEDEFYKQFGMVVCDEVHRVSAPTFSEVIQSFPAKRRIGLTATPERTDGLEIIFHLHLGSIVHEIEGQELNPEVKMVTTKTTVPKKRYTIYNGQTNIPKLITALTVNEDRNAKIVSMLVKAAEAGRKILVLTDRTNHVDFLRNTFCNTVDDKFTTGKYTGSTSKEDRKRAKEKDLIFATTQMAKEGLDIKDLDTLFLTSPTSSHITVQQASGRILRNHPDKKDPMVIDFVDKKIPICEGMAKKRYKIYEDLGYDIDIV